MLIRGQKFHWGERTYLMAILNTTPDSFSDGGQFDDLDRAITQAELMARSGADIIDIGGQSTRPGAETISLETEINRVIPLIKAIRSHPEIKDIPLSIDTTRVAVAAEAVAHGADLINDISGATFEPEMLDLAAKLGVPIILMHLRGTPQTMQQLTDYQDLIGEIYQFFQERINAAIKAGIDQDKIILDPGIGFAKTYQQNLEIFRELPQFSSLKCPLLIGPSRKSFIGIILSQPDPQKRIWGTAATCVSAIERGADILRVHDVKEMYDVCRVADKIYRAN